MVDLERLRLYMSLMADALRSLDGILTDMQAMFDEADSVTGDEADSVTGDEADSVTGDGNDGEIIEEQSDISGLPRGASFRPF